MEKRFRRTLDSLDEIFSFISDFFEQNSIEEMHSFTVNLVVEELFTNMVKYTGSNQNDIEIELSKNDGDLKIVLTDFDVEPFDITKAKDVDVSQHLQQRRIGGLGLHLVRKMMDKIDYEYNDRVSRITLVKRLEN